MAPRTAFVTGGTGFLGQNLVRELVAGGWRVTVLHRPSSNVEPLRGLGVDLAAGDVLDAASIERAMPQRVDAVFHAAADLSFWRPARERQERINVLGTRNVVRAALARRAGRFVHTSSIAVYGFSDGVITEESPRLGERSWIHYFRTKALAEREVRAGIERGLDAVIMNPANVVGRYDVRNWSRLFTLVHARKLPALPTGEGSFTHARETARAHVAAVDRGRTGENYLLGGADAGYAEVIRLIARLLGDPEPGGALPPVALRAAARVSLWLSYLTRREPDITPEGVAVVLGRQRCSSEKAERELGYRPAALETMFRDCMDWMVETGRLG